MGMKDISSFSVSDDISPSTEVAAIRDQWSGSVYEGAIVRLCDSHEALRAANDSIGEAYVMAEEQIARLFTPKCESCGVVRPDGDEDITRHWSEFKGNDGREHIVCPACDPVMGARSDA